MKGPTESVCAIQDERQTQCEHVVEFYRDAAKEHRWRIKDANGRVVAVSSEGYKKYCDG